METFVELHAIEQMTPLWAQRRVDGVWNLAAERRCHGDNVASTAGPERPPATPHHRRPWSRRSAVPVTTVQRTRIPRRGQSQKKDRPTSLWALRALARG